MPDPTATSVLEPAGSSSDKHRKNVEDWRGIDQICLIVGYALLLGAALLRVVLPVS